MTTSAYVPPSLPASVATSIAWYGDAQPSGSIDSQPKPPANPPARFLNAGNDDTGGPRQSTLIEGYKRGVRFPMAWLKGGVSASTPNMPTGQWLDECHGGETAVQCGTAFAARFAAHPASAIVLHTGAVDVDLAVAGGASDHDAAATGNAGVTTCFADIKAAQPTLPILFCAPMFGLNLIGAALLLLPLLQATVAAAVAGGQKIVFLDTLTPTLGTGTSGLFANTTTGPNAFAFLIAGGLIMQALARFPF